MALFITLSFFLNKLMGPFHELLLNPFVIGGIYALISFFGFLWVLSFKINTRILLLVVPHASLIIFSNMLFMQMFFDKAFGRVYETVLMFFFLIFIFLITYITFLTSNVFAVSSFKKIPLEAVAKTTIYIISAMSVFFASYGFLSLEMPIPISVVLLFIVIFFYIIALLSYFYLETSTVLAHGALVFWNIMLVTIGAILFSARVEFVALLAAAVFYYSVGLFMVKKEQITMIKFLEYLLILLFTTLIGFYFLANL